MSRLSAKLSILIPVTMLLGVIALWQFPFARFVLMMVLLLFSVARALAAVIAKQRGAHLQGRITSAVFARNVLMEMTALLLMMLLAGWLGRSMAQVATRQIHTEPNRLIAGIMAGLLVGIGVGMIARQGWGQFVGASRSDS